MLGDTQWFWAQEPKLLKNTDWEVCFLEKLYTQLIAFNTASLQFLTNFSIFWNIHSSPRTSLNEWSQFLNIPQPPIFSQLLGNTLIFLISRFQISKILFYINFKSLTPSKILSHLSIWNTCSKYLQKLHIFSMWQFSLIRSLFLLMLVKISQQILVIKETTDKTKITCFNLIQPSKVKIIALRNEFK